MVCDTCSHLFGGFVVLQAGLSKNFGEATAAPVDCPDLTEAPFSLAAPGLCGSPRLCDVGGVPNLVPLVNRSKVYNLKEVAVKVGLPGAFFIGAGAGSSRLAGLNCEVCGSPVMIFFSLFFPTPFHSLVLPSCFVACWRGDEKRC